MYTTTNLRRRAAYSTLSRTTPVQVRLAAAALLAVVCLVSLLAAAEPVSGPGASLAVGDPKVFAREQLRLTDSEMTALVQGQPIAKTLSATTKREVTTAGGVRIRGSAAAFVARFRTLEGFRTSSFVQQIGKFSATPAQHDLDPLTFEAEDLQALRGCRVGSCEVRLSAADIQRFAREVDWRSPQAHAQAAAVYKSVLFAHLTAYRLGGRENLIQYHDHDAPLRLAAETEGLLGVSPSLMDHAPAFRDYVRHYPFRTLAHTEDFFYWSKETFGFKPVVGLNHVSVYAPGPGEDAIIATTQIYASHYMDGSIAINTLIADPGQADEGFYWLYLNRSRIGRLAGLLGTLSRPIIQSKTRAGLVKSLRQTKLRMEAPPPR